MRRAIFYARFRAGCEVYARDYGIPYLDSSHDTRFQDNPEYFVDSDHLSVGDSEAFKNIFFGNLQAYDPAS